MGIKDLMKRSETALSKPDVQPGDADRPARLVRPITAPGAAAAMRPAMLELEARAEHAEAEAARLKQTAGKPFLVSLDLLVSVPGRRRKLTEEQLSDLTENLRSNPLVQPVVVKPLANGRFEIVSGENRVAAYRAIGNNEIQCTLFDAGAEEGSDGRTVTAAFYANLMQPSLPDFEKYLGFKEIMARTKLGRTEVAQAAGISLSLLSQLMIFDQLPATVNDQLRQAPSALGHRAARKAVELLTSAGAQEALEALLPNLIARRITQEEMLRSVAAKIRASHAPKPPLTSVKFKVGRASFCDFRSAGVDVRISFKDEDTRAVVEAEILEVLKRHATANS